MFAFSGKLVLLVWSSFTWLYDHYLQLFDPVPFIIGTFVPFCSKVGNISLFPLLSPDLFVGFAQKNPIFERFVN